MTVPSSVTTQRQILLFWLPLAASWLLMGAEVPVLQAAIARLADVETQLAAFGIVMSLEIAIESPVIMLLATTTALCTSARNYLTLRRFMIWINVASTAVALLVAFTPLYDFIVRSLMRIPSNIADAARPGMGIMTLWTAAIGVRRFYQGVMIRHGQTRFVGFGTAVRLISSGGTGIMLAVFTPLPGVQVGSIALMAGVSTEALFAALAVRPTVKRVLSDRREMEAEAFSMGDIARYHAPLAATSLLSLLAQPLIGAGLARMPHPEENLAAWPVVWGILFIFRSPAFALPEAVIALISQRRLQDPVRTFSLQVGGASTVVMVLVVATPLIDLYVTYVAGLPASLSQYVFPAILLGVGLPFINSIHSWLRGLLLAAHSTNTIYWGMGLNLLVTGIVVIGGVLVHTRGAETAVIALTAALVVEIMYLRKARRTTAVA